MGLTEYSISCLLVHSLYLIFVLELEETDNISILTADAITTLQGKYIY
jgi:hypothetical protein